MGIDGIGPKLLKHCGLALYKSIQHLFMLSISHHYVPEDWHLHLVIPRKCVLLRFSAKCPLTSYNYTIGDNPIATTELHKDLGVIMSNNLSWAEHLKFISSRAYKLLGLVRRSLSRSHHPNIKRILYISLIRSQLTYILFTSWRPHLLKHIMSLERVQRRATKFILNDFSSDYKSRLVALQILPLMMQLEVNDIMFFIRCLQSPDDSVSFSISSFVSFCTGSSRSSAHLKLKHSLSRTNTISHFYFNRIPRLWNSLPVINGTSPSTPSERNLFILCGTTLCVISSLTILALFIFFVLAVNVHV